MGALRCIQAVQNNSDFLPMLLLKYVVDQRRLARSKVASNNSQRDLGQRKVLKM